jgi:acyl-CoA reductase-like NAD-dependent aldehyde dehydrogenase
MGSGQQRHDILMKFYNLMRGHEDDLARIIVSPCILLSKLVHTPWQTLENGKTLAEAKVGTSGCSGTILHVIATIRAKMLIVPPSSR